MAEIRRHADDFAYFVALPHDLLECTSISGLSWYEKMRLDELCSAQASKQADVGRLVSNSEKPSLNNNLFHVHDSSQSARAHFLPSGSISDGDQKF